MNYTVFRLISFLTFIMGFAIICINIYIENDSSTSIFQDAIAIGAPEEFAIFTPGCKIPKLDPFHSSIKKYIEDYTGKVLQCTSIAMITANGNKLTVNKNHPNFDPKNRCRFRALVRHSEDSTNYGETGMINIENGTLITHEFITVECFNSSQTRIYQDFFAFMTLKPQVEKRCAEANKSKNSLSVLLLGLDSVSKNSYIRHMKLVDKYIRENLTFIELHGYNKLGLNTYPNMVPFLTGKLEEEYKFDHKKTNLNVLPLVWKDFALRGYRTLFAEDCADMASFNYLKRGFDRPPSDYYMRPFSIAVDGSEMKKKLREGCFHNRTEPQVVYKWLFDFFQQFPNDPLYAHVFLTRLSHDDYNTVAFYDKPLVDVLRALNDNGHLNRTIVLFLSDHGYRFGGIRTTYVGHLEDKLPFFFFLLPKWFPKVYPEHYKSLRLNEKRLATPLDMHATLLDILDDLKPKGFVDQSSRSLSLFAPIPLNRTCQTANIEAQYCTCFERQQIAVDSDWAKTGAKLLLKSINEMMAEIRNSCVALHLNEIIEVSAHDVEINKDKKELYTNLMITFEVKPSLAVFQGIALYNHMSNNYVVEKNIDRLNKYGNQSICINDPHLRLYCYCKENIE